MHSRSRFSSVNLPSLRKFCAIIESKTWLMLLVIFTLLTITKSDCLMSQVTLTQENCTICYNGQVYDHCTYQKDKISTQLSQYKCQVSCCSMKYATQVSLCNNFTSAESSVNSGQSQLVTILIIVFFSIPVVICMCIMITSCCRQNRNATNRQSGEFPLSASNINIAQYKLDEVAPFMMDQSITCSICIETSCNIRTCCGHSYHSLCLVAWIHKKEKCPMCVGREFNPIAIYCTKCYRSVKLSFLVDKMEETQKQQWNQYQKLICQRCQEPQIGEISLLVTVLSEQRSKQPDPADCKDSLQHK